MNTLNKAELISLSACSCGLETFIKAHGDNDVTIQQALKSNGAEDVMWYLSNTNKDYSQLDDVLRLFARKQAMLNISLIKPHCSASDYEFIVQWLSTGDESLKSAVWSAARSAARSAAESAAWSAAWSAARSAARSAAESAAWDAAWSAARSAAESAAASAAKSTAESAAWSAARSAARSAAWSAAADMLIDLLNEEKL